MKLEGQEVVKVEEGKILSNMFGNLVISWAGLIYQFGEMDKIECSVELFPHGYHRVNINRVGEENTLWFDTTEEKANEIKALFKL